MKRDQVGLDERRRFGGLLLMASGGLKIAIGRLKRAGVPEDVVLLETLERILYSAAIDTGVADQ